MALTLDGQDLPSQSQLKARQRLGAGPLVQLSDLLTEAWGSARQVHPDSLRKLAIDGVVWPNPDIADNQHVSLGTSSHAC